MDPSVEAGNTKIDKKDLTIVLRNFLIVFKFSSGADVVSIVAAITFCLIKALSFPGYVFALGYFLNQILEFDESLPDMLPILIVIGVVCITAHLAHCLASGLATNRMMYSIRFHFYQAILRQEVGYYDDSVLGQVSALLEQNLIIIQEGISSSCYSIVLFVVQVVAAIAFSFKQHAKLTLIAASSFPIILAASGVVCYYGGNATVQENAASSKAGKIAEETLQNFRTVAAFGVEEKQLSKFGQSVEKAFYFGQKIGHFTGIGMGIAVLSHLISTGLACLYIQIQYQKLLLEDRSADMPKNFLVVFFLTLYAAVCLGLVVPPIISYVKAIYAYLVLVEIIDRESKLDPFDERGKKDCDLDGDIVFNKAVFFYPTRPDVPVLDNFDFRIKDKESTALVGASGCGKSTIVNLLLRYYDLESGVIYINKRPIKNMNLGWLRDQIAVVHQTPSLFNMTIRDNILLGKLNATQEELEDAAKKADAYEFITAFPDGFLTYVGEGGSQLSGGQKQRIAIARALIRKPKILILDEATSALDTEAEKMVQATLDKLIESKVQTTIVIAHRLSTIRFCDNICVLGHRDKGDKIVLDLLESGTHNELLKNPQGYYTALVNAELTDFEKFESLSTLKDSIQKVMLKRSSINSCDSRQETVATPRARNSTAMRREGSLLKALAEKTSIKTLMKKAGYDMKKKNAEKKKKYDEESSTLITVRNAPRKNLTGIIIEYISNHHLRFIITAILTLLKGAAAPGLIYLFIYALQFMFTPEFSKGAMITQRWNLQSIFIFSSIATGLLYASQSIAQNDTSTIFTRNQKKKYMEELVHKEVAFLDHSDHSTGLLLTILTFDTLAMRKSLLEQVFYIIQSSSLIIGALILAYIHDSKQSLICSGIFLLLIPVDFLDHIVCGRYRKDIQENLSLACTQIDETLQRLKLIHGYNLHTVVSNLYSIHISRLYFLMQRFTLLHLIMSTLSLIILFVSQLVLCFLLKKKFLDNNRHDMPSIISISQDVIDSLLALYSLMIAAFVISSLAGAFMEFNEAYEPARRYFHVINKESRLDARSPEGLSVDSTISKFDIKIENAAFFYESRPDVQIFKNFNLTVNPGETIAFVGASGCGKSTIVQLLERFYDLETCVSTTQGAISDGRILIDDHDIRHFNLRSYRKSFSIVSQEPVLFNDTIMENIRYGNLEATDEEIIESAKRANAHDFILAFDNGYHTMVGSSGGQLSGGQRQRIAIARAILRKAKVLILDEATSALDNKSEKLIQATLDRIVAESNNKFITFIVAHRLSSIRNATKIIVLERKNSDIGSAIVEIGTHAELMKIPNGVYRAMVQAG